MLRWLSTSDMLYFGIVVSLSFLPVASKWFCDEHCTCHDNSVICSGVNLTYIPRIPPNTALFVMNGTGLTSIDKNAFDNFSVPLPNQMTFSNNRLENIHPLAFSRFKIRVLRITREPNLKIMYIKHMLDNIISDRMQIIQFSYNNWNELPADLFRSFIKNRMRSLYLDGNKFTFINCSSFAPLTRLLRLSLTENSIIHISLFGIPGTLRNLFLQQNLIAKVPNWCKDRDRKNSFLPDIEILRLDENVIGDLGKHAFFCLPKLSTLVLNNNKIGKIRDNVFSNMPSLTTLRTSNIASNGHLKKIEPFAFNSSSLQTLKMEDNRFYFQKDHLFDPDHIFANCKNLLHLNLANNYMYNEVKRTENMLLPLTKLKTLDLAQSNIVRFPILKSFGNLEKLNLARNKISTWKGKEVNFSYFKTLKSLDLSANRIAVINETSFPNNFLISLKKIDFSFNPFRCTCDLLWFTEWIKTTNTTLVGYPQSYKCNQPPALQYSLLRNYVNAEKTCPPWNPLYTLAIVLSGSSLVFIVIIITIAKCQINIRNFIYLIRIRRKGYLPLLSSEDFEYDAFVVYCDEDGEWVRKTLLDKIENKGFKLCIHERDFVVGESIADNVGLCLEKSKKVIVVMSNEFTKNEWCQWEVDVVLEKLRSYGPDIFLLIMLKPIDSKHITSKLRSMIKCSPCLSYKLGLGEDLFWKAVTAAISKPIGHPPTALL